MTRSNTGTSDGRAWRRVLEVTGWLLLIAILWGTDTAARIGELQNDGLPVDRFRLLTEQVTSGLAAFVMVGFVTHWLLLFPLSRRRWLSAIPGHIAGSVLFAFGHYSLMVLLRWTWYGLHDLPYIWREPFVANLVVEYQKDIKIYLGMLVVISAYRLLRSGGTQTSPAERPAPPGRLLVQTGSGERLLELADVDYLESSRNYVSVFADNREYLVRDTLTNLAQRLASANFVQVHRRYVVNVDRVRELRSAPSGQGIVLVGSAEIPVGRRYRDEFRARFSPSV